MKVVPVTIVALTPTNGHVDVADVARSGAAGGLQCAFTMCQRSRMRPVPRPAAKGVEQQFAVELDTPILDEIERLAFVTRAVGFETIGAASPKRSSMVASHWRSSTFLLRLHLSPRGG